MWRPICATALLMAACARKVSATLLEHYATAATFGQSQRVAMRQQAAAIAKEVAA